ncbi:FAD-binding protein [Candidatus Peregrinibacteria bacterium]|nr:FAD-binding protein [Candidatus Peregrinibacteria bacterium]MBI3816187.1 FAD-binding protein [Candidatus Peregrinibacteria bacterium]
MTIQEPIPIGRKTTMRIGGIARYYAELASRRDVEEAVTFARSKNVPLIVLGGGSNTIFADGTIEALVVKIMNDAVTMDEKNARPDEHPFGRVTVGTGKILASLLNELAAQNLDLSPLTGIPGTIGGAIFGNAGQCPKGIWIDRFVESVTAFVNGAWKVYSRAECDFRYRESVFKELRVTSYELRMNPIIWEATLIVPSKPGIEVKIEIERLIKKRIETQPHLKTAGSCFKALPDGTPAWKLIDAAGLRGLKIGGIQVSEKHANFLLNMEKGTFADTVALVEQIQKNIPEIAGVEMRFYGEDGTLAL